MWIASVVSNIGTWMQNVGGVWLMTTLTRSPLLIALMQAATSLPVFLVGLMAGAVADLFDRRRLLIVTQAWMTLAALLLAVFTWAGMISPALLLVLTFAMGLGSAMNNPAWQAIMPELVGRELLTPAVALNGAGNNIARAVGPALGGLIVALLGPGAVFLLNALSFLGVIGVLYRWERPVVENDLPAESLIGAIRAGLRYARYNPDLQAVLARSAVFILCASGLWALLPAVAKLDLGLGASGYGLLLACLGIGCLLGTVILPPVARRLTLDRRIVGGSLLFGVATLALAYFQDMPLLCLMMIVAGVGWLVLMVTVNVATQLLSPTWVQARTMGLYAIVTQGGLALGSTAWGVVATHASNSVALLGAGAGLLVGVIAVWIWPLPKGEFGDITPSQHWPEPVPATPVKPDDGPVLVTVQYRIEPQKASEFREAMEELRAIRQRDGAVRWELFEDLVTPGAYMESYLVESWAEHLRQHGRVTRADVLIERRVQEFHVDKTPPRVMHLLWARVRRTRRLQLKNIYRHIPWR